MRSNIPFLFFFLLISCVSEDVKEHIDSQLEEINRERLERDEGYFGLHFDFHAQKTDSSIGASLTDEQIDSLIKLVRPDYIQVDCKGHTGISSYPTEIGFEAGGYSQDILALIRKVTARYDVPLLVHFSGVFDKEFVKAFPGQAVLDKDNQPHPRATSFFGNYKDKYMLPQMKEVIDRYQVDGFWVDGDCWAVEPDYSKKSLANYKGDISDKATFLEYNRGLFKSFLGAYVDSIHNYKNNIQIASNWAYSSHMPEPVETNVDFLSGDLSPNMSVIAAEFEGRCLRHQGKS